MGGTESTGQSTSIAGWTSELAPFKSHASKRGKAIKLSESCSVAERERPENSWQNGVVYTTNPLPADKVWRITVKNTSTTGKYGQGLRVGVTGELPKEAPTNLPTELICSDSCFCWGEKKVELKFSLDDLQPEQSVGLGITSKDKLVLFLDGKYQCELATLPAGKQWWGAASVCGKCTKIQSEMLSEPKK